MTIQIDSREHKWELARIQRQLTALGCKTIVSKLYVGDYQSLRFQRELVRAKEAEIKLIILIEHGDDIRTLEDVYFWDNPRLLQSPKAINGKSLYRSLCTIRDRYNVRFEFCSKHDTGRKIMELLDG